MKAYRYIAGVLVACASVFVTPARAAGGEAIAAVFAQFGGGCIAHYAGNQLGNWLLDQADDFPSPALSSLSVVATSFAVSAVTSSAIYGMGRAFEDDPRSFGWTMLGGLSAVGGASLAGILVARDDGKSGAAVGSVIGRYLAPVSAVAFYYWRDGGKKGSGRGKFVVPLVRVGF